MGRRVPSLSMTAMSASVRVGKATASSAIVGPPQVGGECSAGLCELEQLKREGPKTDAPTGALILFGWGTGPVGVRIGGRERVLFLAVEILVAVRLGLVRLVLRLR